MNRWLKDCTLIGWVNDPLSSSPELPCFPLLGPTFPLSYCTSLVNWCQLPLLWAASLLNYGWGLLIYLFSEPPHASFLCVTYFFSELPLTSALFFECPVLWATPFEPFSESSLSLSLPLSLPLPLPYYLVQLPMRPIVLAAKGAEWVVNWLRKMLSIPPYPQFVHINLWF